MNPVQAELLATIGAAAQTSSARAAVDVGVDGNLIANPDASRVFGNLHHFTRELVPQDARVGIDRMASSQSVKVAATHSHAPNAHQRFSPGSRGALHLAFDELTRRRQ